MWLRGISKVVAQKYSGENHKRILKRYAKTPPYYHHCFLKEACKILGNGSGEEEHKLS